MLSTNLTNPIGFLAKRLYSSAFFTESASLGRFSHRLSMSVRHLSRRQFLYISYDILLFLYGRLPSASAASQPFGDEITAARNSLEALQAF